MPPNEDAAGAASLDDSLALVLPALGPALAGPAQVAAVRALARRLPPVHVAGFECRLDDDPRVDLQQGVRRDDGGAAATVAFVRDRWPGGAPVAWRRIAALCERWLDARSALARGMAELWIEIDVDDASPDDATPSAFVTFVASARGEPRALPDDALQQLLGGPVPPAMSAAHERLTSGLTKPAFVSNVGVMLGRGDSGARVHVADLPLREWESYLACVGWPGDAAAARAQAERHLAWADRAVLCFDVRADGALGPRLGIELFLTRRPGAVDLRWGPLVDGLVAAGQCTGPKGAALLAWPGTVRPIDAAWPDSLLMIDLARPTQQLGVVDRRLSHVKVSPGGGAAKAYFGFGHVAATPATRTPVAPPAVVTSSEPTANAVRDAAARALDFVLGARTQAGWWRDFHDDALERRLVRYVSDEWVTAYVGYVCSGLDDPRARAAAAEAWALLERRRPDAVGWGYNATFPPDADTTAWAARLADSLGSRGPRAEGARAFVRAHVLDAGAVACYLADDCQRYRDYFVVGDRPFAGWCAAHACITAAAVPVVGRPALRYLLDTQREDGSWGGYWWPDDEYTTALAAEALAADDGEPESIVALARAAAWAASRVDADGAVRSRKHGGPSAFATALCARALAAAEPRLPNEAGRAALRRALGWLLGAQRADGSWPPSAYILIPDTEDMGPVASEARLIAAYVDYDGVWTTATALAALDAAARVSATR